MIFQSLIGYAGMFFDLSSEANGIADMVISKKLIFLLTFIKLVRLNSKTEENYFSIRNFNHRFLLKRIPESCRSGDSYFYQSFGTISRKPPYRRKAPY